MPHPKPVTSGDTPRYGRVAARTLRHVAVGATSLAIVGSAAVYAVAPAGEAIGATVTAVTAAAKGKENIKGRVLMGKRPAVGTTVLVVARVNGSIQAIARRHADRNGRFVIPLRPGRYTVLFKRSKNVQKMIAITVKTGQSLFLAAEVKRTSPGGWSLVPVIFNY